MAAKPARAADTVRNPRVEEPTARSREEERAERLMRLLLAQAKRAREDVVEFFSFAMKEERNQDALECVPLQRVLFSFVLHHPLCVVRMPIGSSKTYCMATLGLWLLGNDTTQRGAIISASQEQAMKPLGMVQDYIEHDGGAYPELGLVFPKLRQSHRAKDAWQQQKLVVDRPPGIRDPSLVAIGYGGKLPGARLSWILVDDILTEDNTSTPAARHKVNRWFMSTVLSRKDLEGSRIVVTNTPWNPGTQGSDSGDLTYKLERAGWPTITVDIEGDITITNADAEWDCDDIRPSHGGKHPDTNTHRALLPTELPTEVYRLTAHDAAKFGAQHVVRDAEGKPWAASPEEIEAAEARGEELERYDLDEVIPSWPERFPVEVLDQLRRDFRESYGQLYKCKTRDDASAVCKKEWFETAKRRANAAGFTNLVSEYRGPNFVGTGIDLGIGTEEVHDWTVFFAFELIPEITIAVGPELRTYKNMRRLLNVKYVRAEGQALVAMIIEWARAYGGILKVETNAAQKWLRQWTLASDVSIPLLSHTTGKNKHHRTLGVRGLFVELENGAWLVPSDAAGNVAPDVQRWINEALDWRPPPAHTGDALIASWIARTLAHEFDRNGKDAGKVADRIALNVSLR